MIKLGRKLESVARLNGWWLRYQRDASGVRRAIARIEVEIILIEVKAVLIWKLFRKSNYSMLRGCVNARERKGKSFPMLQGPRQLATIHQANTCYI